MAKKDKDQVREFDAKDAKDPSMHLPAAKTPAENEMPAEWKQERVTRQDDATSTGDHTPDTESLEKGAGLPDMQTGEIGRIGPIGKHEIGEALATFEKYKSGRANMERRIIDNERWWKLRHWDIIPKPASDTDTNRDPEPVSAWLFNSLSNKHADAMDNYPTIAVLPRAADDVEDAALLSEIMPIILERNRFRKTYNDAWWYKLKQGSVVYGIFWDNSIDNGVGDINVRQVDLLNIFWEPGVRNIQQSRNVFNVELMDNDILEETYPFLRGKTGTDTSKVSTYITDDYIDTQDKTAVFDWYYKRTIGTKTVLHYCKFAAGEVIYATENDPELAEVGWYDHGNYPFVFDTLFPIETSPAGYGYIDVMKDPQMYIDKMNQIIAKNTLMSSKTRYIVKRNAGISKEDLADFSRDVIEAETQLDADHFRELNVSPLPAQTMNYLQMRIEELKETSGNRDWSQGATSAGVTAASAIAALQEAGSKLSRDMIAAAYDAFEEVNHQVLELIRQFYDETRFFRVVGEDGMDRFVEYDNRNIREQAIEEGVMGVEGGFRKPIFDIKISAMKQNPFNRISQNELAIQLYNLGVFNPQMGDQAMGLLDMMEFEGKDQVVQRVSNNMHLLQQIQMLQQQVAQLTGVVDMQNGTNLQGAAAASGMFDAPEQVIPGGKTKRTNARPATGESGVTAKARARSAQAGTPKA